MMSDVPFAMGDLMLTNERAELEDAPPPPVEARLTEGRLRTYLELVARTSRKVSKACSSGSTSLAPRRGRRSCRKQAN